MTVRSMHVALGLRLIVIAIVLPPLAEATLVKDLGYEAIRGDAFLNALKDMKKSGELDPVQGKKVDQLINKLQGPVDKLVKKVNSMDNLWDQADETGLKLLTTVREITHKGPLSSTFELFVQYNQKFWLAKRLTTSIMNVKVSKKMKQVVEKVEKLLEEMQEEGNKKPKNDDDVDATKNWLKSKLNELDAELDKLEKACQALQNSKIARIKAQLGQVGAGAKSLYRKSPKPVKIGAGVALIGGGGLWAAKKAIWPSKSKTKLPAPINKEAGNSSNQTDTSTTRYYALLRATTHYFHVHYGHIWLVVLVVLLLLIIATILATGYYYAGWFISGGNGKDQTESKSSKKSAKSGKKLGKTANKSPASSGQTS